MKKKIIMVTMLIGLALCIPTHVHASTGTAKSQSQLEKTLADRSVDTVKISTSKKKVVKEFLLEVILSLVFCSITSEIVSLLKKRHF